MEKTENTQFLQMPMSILDCEVLNPTQKIMLCIIIQYCKYQGTGKATILSKHFEKRLGLTTKTVSSQIKKIEELGYIKVQRIKTEYSSNLIPEYTIDKDKLKEDFNITFQEVKNKNKETYQKTTRGSKRDYRMGQLPS